MIFKSDNRPSDLNGFLDNGSDVHGELRFQTSFRVDGRFTGTVKSDGDLIVGEGGEIEGEVSVGQAFISGTVRGTLRASRKVQISSLGKVYAEIETAALVVEDGALFEGRCSMSRDGARSSAPPKLLPAKAPREG